MWDICGTFLKTGKKQAKMTVFDPKTPQNDLFYIKNVGQMWDIFGQIFFQKWAKSGQMARFLSHKTILSHKNGLILSHICPTKLKNLEKVGFMPGFKNKSGQRFFVLSHKCPTKIRIFQVHIYKLSNKYQ